MEKTVATGRSSAEQHPRMTTPNPGAFPPACHGDSPLGQGSQRLPGQPLTAQTPSSAGLTLPAPKGSVLAKGTQKHRSGPL